jgi:ATP-dependent Clp protease ATP-binding subunit ClpA
MLTNGCALQSERHLQSSLLRTSLVNHLRRHPESVLVIEEYDKMDCDSRNLLRQLLDKGIAANVTASRSIIILEANTGSPHLIKLLQNAGSRDRLSPELMQRSLKDIVYNKWISESCGVR